MPIWKKYFEAYFVLQGYLRMDQQILNFVSGYYEAFNNARQNLFTLYDASSTLSYEVNKFRGVNEIAHYLGGLPKLNRTIAVCDSVPMEGSSLILVLVNGQVAMEGEARIHRFAHTFVLAPVPEGGVRIKSEIFAFIYQ